MTATDLLPEPEPTELDDTVERIAELPGPLSPAWHTALATWGHSGVRHTWAQRPDAPEQLLARAARDPEPDVAAAALSNPRLPLPTARELAGRLGALGSVALACRPDCPDPAAADLLHAGLTQATSHVISAAAAGLTGKPAAQTAAVDHFTAAGQLVPERLLCVLAPQPAEAHLTLQLARRSLSLFTVRHLVACCTGTPGQRAAVRRWLDTITAGQATRRPADITLIRTELPWWCSPTPVTSAEQAGALLGMLRDVATRCRDRDLLAVTVTALPFRPQLFGAFAANPAVDDRWLTRLAATLPTPELAGLLDAGQEPRARRTVRALLEAGGRERPDVRTWPTPTALHHPELLPDLLERYLHPGARPILDAAVHAAGSEPLGRLLRAVDAAAAPAAGG